MTPQPLPPPLPQRKNNWWFVLGHEPLLSAAEILAALKTEAQPGLLLLPNSSRPLVLRLTATLDPQGLIRRLGGTIKIGEELGEHMTEEKLLEAMAEELRLVEGKINFGISIYPSMSLRGGTTKQSPGLQDSLKHGDRHALRGGGSLAMTDTIEQWGKKLKKLLKEEGRSARYVFKKETVLSSATVVNNNLDARGREFLVCPLLAKEGRGVVYALAKTRVVQPFEEFSRRDFGRPGRDDVSGMLPPKLAMMMINISGASRDQVLLDPFCGSGTILSEALLLGYNNLIGSDVSEKAVEDTKKNIAWTLSQSPLEGGRGSAQRGSARRGDVRVFQSEAAKLSKQLSPATVDTIVTEPFLGPPLKGRESRDEVAKNTQELARLYLGAFQEFKEILKPQGIVVFIIPRFQVQGQWITISNTLAPELKKLGFFPEPILPENIRSETFLLYHRANQRVGREIWKFKFNG